MNTWRTMHPGWEYILIDNNAVLNTSWVNKKHILQYFEEQKWHGVADLVRYEMQFLYGGVIAPADSICLRPLDELLDEVEKSGCDCFTCPESDLPEFKNYIVPILGATQCNELLWDIIIKLHKLDSVAGTSPWKTTGNKFVGEMIKEYSRLKMFPYYYFIPTHRTGAKYEGDDKIFSEQMWGTTKKCYGEGR